MNTLYESNGNAYDNMGYASLNGYTMHREPLNGFQEPWTLRDAHGEVVDRDAYRSKLAERNGFRLDEYPQ